MRLSSDGKWLILWMNDKLTKIQRLQIRNFSNFATVQYDRTFPNFVN
jgi:hypothetical protein